MIVKTSFRSKLTNQLNEDQHGPLLYPLFFNVSNVSADTNHDAIFCVRCVMHRKNVLIASADF